MDEGQIDHDRDGTPNDLDPDSDGDGIPDATEGRLDQDGDGVPNYLDPDSDGDGITDSDEGRLDQDGDGVPNYLDPDSDGDGITDSDEGRLDQDSDGFPNYLDPDSAGVPAGSVPTSSGPTAAQQTPQVVVLSQSAPASPVPSARATQTTNSAAGPATAAVSTSTTSTAAPAQRINLPTARNSSEPLAFDDASSSDGISWFWILALFAVGLFVALLLWRRDEEQVLLIRLDEDDVDSTRTST